MNAVVDSASADLQSRIDAVQAFISEDVGNLDHLTMPLFGWSMPAWISVHGLMVTLATVVLLVLFGLLYNRRAVVPTGLTNALEAMVVFIRDQISIPYLGVDDGRRFTPYFCSLFFFILAMNLIGLIPGLRAATANLAVTGALASITFVFMVGGAMVRHGVLGFFKGLAPQGVPWPILLVLLPIEFIGLFIKAGALTIRLFANMLAGHMVVFFMLGMMVIFGAWALPAVAMAIMIYLMEIFIAFLQAYIFTLLSAVFIGQSYHPAH